MASDLCDLFAQDCPEGQKCAPISLDGDDFWDSNSCVPVAIDPDGPGEPCTDIGTHGDGLDSCAEGSFCFYVDPTTKIGQCMAHCQGTPREPTCPLATTPSCWGLEQVCAIDFANAMTVCFRQLCDPILQNCPSGAKCVIEEIGDFAYLICLIDPEERPFAAACQQHMECGPGALCLSPDAAIECDPEETGCCTPVCDAANPAPCPGVGQVCVPVVQNGAYICENLGVCRLPP